MKRNFDSVYDLKQRLTTASDKMRGAGNDLVTKVYPSDVIPDHVHEVKRDYRPNNFLASDGADLEYGRASGLGVRASQMGLMKGGEFSQQSMQGLP